jgi:hypothetical protein
VRIGIGRLAGVGFLVNPARIHLIALAESGWFIINGTEQSIDYILTTMPVS